MEKRAERTNLKTKVMGALIVDESFVLINISDTGALINTPQKLLLNSVYSLKFDFVDRSKKHSLKVKSKVVREKLLNIIESKSGKKVPVYEVGLAFVDVKREHIKNLKFLIANKELKKVKQ